MLANQDGDREIPSMIAYKDGHEFHGIEARQHLIRTAKNTLANFRDFLGLPFAKIDPTPSHNSAHLEENNGTPAFRISEKGETEEFLSVSEVVSVHIARLKQSAEEYLGRSVSAAVYTVPTNFSETQRSALVDASDAAGLACIQIIHEPIAEILAHNVGNAIKDELIVVADFGGTRCDAAVVAARGGMYTILATAHDYDLGGAKLDETMVEYLVNEFKKKKMLIQRLTIVQWQSFAMRSRISEKL